MKNTNLIKINVASNNTERGIFFEDKLQFPVEKNTKHYSSQKHVCSTCKEEIDSEISRILIMRDIDGGPRWLCFHFFFPCWSFELLCQKYPDLIIERAGFSIPGNILIKKSSIKNMQKDLELWI